MAVAWERIGSLRDPAALRPWLLRIAARQALDRRRRVRPSAELPLEAVGVSGVDADRVALRQALDGLPPKMRACLSLHYYAGLTVEETAAAMGVSANTVKYHLKTGLERLRQALDAEPQGAPEAETQT